MLSLCAKVMFCTNLQEKYRFHDLLLIECIWCSNHLYSIIYITKLAFDNFYLRIKTCNEGLLVPFDKLK